MPTSLTCVSTPVAGLHGAVDDADVGDDAAVGVEERVEDDRAQRAVRMLGLRRRDEVHEALQQVLDACAGLGGDERAVVHRDRERLLDLVLAAGDVGAREVDLVEGGDDLQVRLEREDRVGDRLRLDALRGVDEQHRRLARGHGAGDLVGEVDVAGRVEEVQEVRPPVARRVAHRDGVRLDGDAALLLQVHRVEQLVVERAGVHGLRQLHDAVGQRRLAVVDVGDDAEVADVGEVGHRGTGGAGGRRAGR